MQSNDLLTVSVRQVIRHRRRYLGVVLAIALGVAGFINILTMSREVKKNFNQDLDLIGGVTVIRLSFDNTRSYQPQWFWSATLAALQRIKGVKELSLTAVKGGATNYHGEQYGFSVLAVDDGYWDVRNFWAQTGNLFGPGAVAGRKRECVLGAELAKHVFGSLDIRGRLLEINNDIYWVSGVLGGVTDSGAANSAFIPLTTGTDRLAGPLLPDRLYLRCQTWDDVSRVAAAIPAVVKSTQSPEELSVEVSWEGLKTGLATGLVDPVSHLPRHRSHFYPGRSGHLERDDGRGGDPHPGDRFEESDGGRGPGYLGTIPDRSSLSQYGRRPAGWGAGAHYDGDFGALDPQPSSGKPLLPRPGPGIPLCRGGGGGGRPLSLPAGQPHGSQSRPFVMNKLS